MEILMTAVEAPPPGRELVESAVAGDGPGGPPDPALRLRVLVFLASEREAGIGRARLLARVCERRRREMAGELARLVAQGLCEEVPGRRTPKLRITERGEAALVDGPVESACGRFSRRMVRGVLRPFRREIERLRGAAGRVAKPVGEAAEAKAEPPTAPAGPLTAAEILDALAALDERERFPGRMVPIFRIRRALGPKGSRPGFDRVLWDLACAGGVRLHKLNDQSLAADDERRDALYHPFTGVMQYYASRGV